MPFAREQTSGANAVCRGAELSCYCPMNAGGSLPNFSLLLPLFSHSFSVPAPPTPPGIFPPPPQPLRLFFLSLVSVKDDSDFVFVSGKLQINYEEKQLTKNTNNRSESIAAGLPRVPAGKPRGHARPRPRLSSHPGTLQRVGAGLQPPKTSLSAALRPAAQKRQATPITIQSQAKAFSLAEEEEEEAAKAAGPRLMGAGGGSLSRREARETPWPPPGPAPLLPAQGPGHWGWFPAASASLSPPGSWGGSDTSPGSAMGDKHPPPVTQAQPTTTQAREGARR